MTLEERALDVFLEALNLAAGSSYSIASRPDRTNRCSRDIDALAESDGLSPLAIEHTRLESYKGQYSSARTFIDHVAPLEHSLCGVFPYCFDLVVPHEALQPGHDWAHMAAALESWFLGNAGSADLGTTRFELPSVPGMFQLHKRESKLHRVFGRRTLPPGEFDGLLRDRMGDCLDHKYDELAAYKAAGATSVLLLHSEDLVLINQDIVAIAVADVLEGEPHPHLDQVWFVWFLGDKAVAYCMMGPDVLRIAAADNAYRVRVED